MKILILHTYYLPFIHHFEKLHTGKKLSYQQKLQLILNDQFGIGDAYSHHLNKLGHQAQDFIVNYPQLNSLWLQKQHPKLSPFIRKTKYTPKQIASYLLGNQALELDTTLQFIRHYQPDVLFIRNVKIFPPEWLQAARPFVKQQLVGQLAYSFKHFEWLKNYDLVISSLPNLLEHMDKKKINAAFLPHGFDKRMLQKVVKTNIRYPVSFVGSFAPVHIPETRALESIAQKIPIHVWGYGTNTLSKDSPLMQNFHGEAWGIKLHTIYSNSDIVINRHGQVDPVKKTYANNLRLFEATGSGALLITDHKKNIDKLFIPDKEIVTYKTTSEAIKKIKFYLKHPSKAKAIAKRGQKRTLKDYSYSKIMKQLVNILES